jgi:aldose 1-epimerase
VGRYGNRIAKGKFDLNGQTYTLAQNNGENCLHGGVKSFDKVLWKARALSRKDGPALELTYFSKDGEEGFPGNLTVKAIYSLTPDNALKLEFSATTDKDTHCNLTHHSYFNLAGKGDVLGYELYINAEKMTPVSASLIPTGELRPVAGTPFDFTKPTPIGARIDQEDEQLKHGAGYDHNWVLKKERKGRLSLAATAFDPSTGRFLEAFTTEPGVQCYTGNYLDGSITGKNGQVYNRRSGFCLEPQHFPDTPNQPTFPSTVLKPGETYRHTLMYKFSVK